MPDAIAVLFDAMFRDDDGYAERVVEESSWVSRRVVGPVLDLLRIGAKPEKLAWSLAAGLVIGVNPLLGSTTVLALAAAYVFRLNLMASQLANHLAYPLELLLLPVFLRVGIAVFHTASFPLRPAEMAAAVKAHPWETTRLLWQWEWHALVVWAAFAAAAIPALQRLLCPVLRRMLDALHDEPVVEK